MIKIPAVFSTIIIQIIAIHLLSITSSSSSSALLSSELLDHSISPPIISPHSIESHEELTLSVGINQTLLCEANAAITWQLPEGFTEIYHIEYDISYLSTDAKHPFKSKLILPNVNYMFVGEYYCIYNDSINTENIEDLKLEFKASRIYIFVDDPENPLVHTENVMIQAIQYSEAIIPCKPTSKSVEVQLIKDDEESHQFDSIYDPAIGFKVKLMHLSDGGVFACQIRNTEHVIHFQVTVNSGTDYVNKPKIESANGSYGTQGEELILKCSVEMYVGVLFSINWSLPNANASLTEGRAEISQTTQQHHPSSPELKIGSSTLKIKNLDRSKDQGSYKCQVVDNSANKNHDVLSVTILDSGEGSLEISEPRNIYRIEVSRRESEAVWLVNYKGYPTPELTWYDNRNQPISGTNSNKYEITTTSTNTKLRIKNLELKDTGTYTLYAYNDILENKTHFELIVKDKPSVKVNDVYVKPNELANLVCECAGYPASIITWLYTPCKLIPHWPSCDITQQKILYVPETEETIEGHELFEVTTIAQKSVLKFIPEQPGIVICTALNTEGNDSTNATVKIGDLNEPLEVWRNNKDLDPIASGDNVTLYCGALAYDYSADLNWYRNNNLIHPDDNIILKDYVTDYSYGKTLNWKSITMPDTGIYECRANYIENEDYNSQEKMIDVLEPQIPTMLHSNLIIGKTMKKSLGEPLRLECEYNGVPIPTIEWYKDDELISLLDDNETRIEMHDNNQILDIKFLKSEDEGTYKCEAINRIGRAERTTLLTISNMPVVSKPVIIGIALLIAILLLCTFYLCYRVRKARKLLRELKAAGLANFEEGDIDRINYEQGLDEQAELLPYDKKYEFPKEKLKLGKQLGAGAFGVVLKAVAIGILPYEDETTVAVKMVKKTADNEVMKALISELKIMVHLGQHLNVVNLLGAVTKNIVKREVMVIVEYCRFGNVQHFLIKHRNYFIDQIIRETDTIDPSIMTTDNRWSNNSGYERNSKGITGINSRGYVGRRSAGANDYFPGGMDSANTEATLISTVPTGDERDSILLSNNSVQPAWRSNYRMDYKGPLRDISTTDLICWSFQVARGMEYLSSRKVLHGDLAARNILLCDNNVVKICDFGLARSMYKSDNYKKKGEAPLPFKWLAIESIGDQVFSTYSDIWSFGIVMWELFSLGKVPYPGMDADQGLYFKLKDGYRMEKPEYATQALYDIMLQCWSAHAESRPLFSKLENQLGKLLENGVADHYIDLNEPYLQMNLDQFSNGQTDYLGILHPPDIMAPSIPHYINSNIRPTNESENIEYLQMNQRNVASNPTTVDANNDSSRSTIHMKNNNELFKYPMGNNSPTTANNLNTNQSPKSRRKIGIPAETVPMLKNNAINHQNSDSETEITTTPEPIKLEIIKPKPRNLINTSNDNYVNVPSIMNKQLNSNNNNNNNNNNKTNLKPEHAVSNPGYVVVGKMTNEQVRT